MGEIPVHQQTLEEGKREPAALELDGLARRYFSALKHFFERRAPAIAHESEDLAQEVFERLANRRGADEIANIEGYLFQTASSVLMDRNRRRKVRHAEAHVEYDDSFHALEDFSPEHVLVAREQVELVIAALQDLPERTRAAFVLHRFEEYRYHEIAKQLGISVSAVEKHIIRALRHIANATRETAE